jgi:hypothetical protein
MHGALVIDGVKTMDDPLISWENSRVRSGVHVGLQPDSYTNRQSVLLMHGHQFDFWNCDEHNRLGKFIANAVGVVGDSLDNLVYDWRGIDYQGHPLIETWDVLTPLTPFDNWPPAEAARTWAEAIEQRRPFDNVTQDSMVFSETFASVMAMVMRSGDLSPANFHVLLCLGHTHNPQSRPWIPILQRFNPWRDVTVAGIRPFEQAFAIKTRYLNSGTVGWWEKLIWAIEITETGQPRLVYWADEDSEPVRMDWELQQGDPIPADGLDGVADWARRYLRGDVATALEGLAAAADQPSQAAEPTPAARVRELVEAGRTPDLSTVIDLLSPIGSTVADSVSRLKAPLVQDLSLADNPWHQAAVILAARGDALLRGTDPRSLGRRLAGHETPVGSVGLGPILWPSMLTGADPTSTMGRLDVAGLTDALRTAVLSVDSDGRGTA